MHLVVKGKYPSLNEYIGKCRTHPQAGNTMKHKYQNMVLADILEQTRRLRIDSKIILHYTFYEQNKKRDKDNVSGFFHKIFQDALVQARIIPNDDWKYIEGFSDSLEEKLIRKRG